MSGYWRISTYVSVESYTYTETVDGERVEKTGHRQVKHESREWVDAPDRHEDLYLEPELVTQAPEEAVLVSDVLFENDWSDIDNDGMIDYGEATRLEEDRHLPQAEYQGEVQPGVTLADGVLQIVSDALPSIPSLPGIVSNVNQAVAFSLMGAQSVLTGIDSGNYDERVRARSFQTQLELLDVEGASFELLVLPTDVTAGPDAPGSLVIARTVDGETEYFSAESSALLNPRDFQFMMTTNEGPLAAPNLEDNVALAEASEGIDPETLDEQAANAVAQAQAVQAYAEAINAEMDLSFPLSLDNPEAIALWVIDNPSIAHAVFLHLDPAHRATLLRDAEIMQPTALSSLEPNEAMVRIDLDGVVSGQVDPAQDNLHITINTQVVTGMTMPDVHAAYINANAAAFEGLLPEGATVEPRLDSDGSLQGYAVMQGSERLPYTVDFASDGTLLSISAIDPVTGAPTVFRPDPQMDPISMQMYGQLGDTGVRELLQRAGASAIDDPVLVAYLATQEGAASFLELSEDNLAAVSERVTNTLGSVDPSVAETIGVEGVSAFETEADLSVGRLERHQELAGLAFLNRLVLQNNTEALEVQALESARDVAEAFAENYDVLTEVGDNGEVTLSAWGYAFAQDHGLSPEHVLGMVNDLPGGELDVDTIHHLSSMLVVNTTDPSQPGYVEPNSPEYQEAMAQQIRALAEETGMSPEQVAHAVGLLGISMNAATTELLQPVSDGYMEHYLTGLDEDWAGYQAQNSGANYDDFVSYTIQRDGLSFTGSPTEIAALTIKLVEQEMGADVSFEEATSAATERLNQATLSAWQNQHEHLIAVENATISMVDAETGLISDVFTHVFEGIETLVMSPVLSVYFSGVHVTPAEARRDLALIDAHVGAYLSGLDVSGLSPAQMARIEQEAYSFMAEGTWRTGSVDSVMSRYMGSQMVAAFAGEITKGLATATVAYGLFQTGVGGPVGAAMLATVGGGVSRVLLDWADRPGDISLEQTAGSFALGAFDSAAFLASYTAATRVYTALAASGRVSPHVATATRFAMEGLVDTGAMALYNEFTGAGQGELGQQAFAAFAINLGFSGLGSLYNRVARNIHGASGLNGSMSEPGMLGWFAFEDAFSNPNSTTRILGPDGSPVSADLSVSQRWSELFPNLGEGTEYAMAAYRTAQGETIVRVLPLSGQSIDGQAYVDAIIRGAPEGAIPLAAAHVHPGGDSTPSTVDLQADPRVRQQLQAEYGADAASFFVNFVAIDDSGTPRFFPFGQDVVGDGAFLFNQRVQFGPNSTPSNPLAGASETSPDQYNRLLGDLLSSFKKAMRGGDPINGQIPLTRDNALPILIFSFMPSGHQSSGGKLSLQTQWFRFNYGADGRVFVQDLVTELRRGAKGSYLPITDAELDVFAHMLTLYTRGHAGSKAQTDMGSLTTIATEYLEIRRRNPNPSFGSSDAMRLNVLRKKLYAKMAEQLQGVLDRWATVPNEAVVSGGVYREVEGQGVILVE